MLLGLGRECSQSGGRRAMDLLRRLLRNGSLVEHCGVSWFHDGDKDWLYVQFWLYGT